MAHFNQENWNNYFYPESDIFINKLDIRDKKVLNSLEYNVAQKRQQEILLGQAPIKRTFDLKHLQSIHKYLFQDLYEWAGKIRNVQIFKEGPVGFDTNINDLKDSANQANHVVKNTNWKNIGRDEFVDRITETYAWVNKAHPFREGNGRTGKVFLDHVAEQSPLRLDYSKVTREKWNEASAYSRPSADKELEILDELKEVFEQITYEPDNTKPTGSASPSQKNKTITTNAQSNQANGLTSGYTPPGGTGLAGNGPHIN